MDKGQQWLHGTEKHWNFSLVRVERPEKLRCSVDIPEALHLEWETLHPSYSGTVQCEFIHWLFCSYLLNNYFMPRPGLMAEKVLELFEIPHCDRTWQNKINEASKCKAFSRSDAKPVIIIGHCFSMSVCRAFSLIFLRGTWLSFHSIFHWLCRMQSILFFIQLYLTTLNLALIKAGC